VDARGSVSLRPVVCTMVMVHVLRALLVTSEPVGVGTRTGCMLPWGVCPLVQLMMVWR
jgi:hypothetical protein